VPARDLSRTLGAICKPRVCHVADKPAAGTSRGKRRELIMSN
jgi:hypothetical protein